MILTYNDMIQLLRSLAEERGEETVPFNPENKIFVTWRRIG